jgi:GNAT superfamily N-acetyltransferase
MRLDTALEAAEISARRGTSLEQASAQFAARLNTYAQSLGKEPVAYEIYSYLVESPPNTVLVRVSMSAVSCAISSEGQVIWSWQEKVSTRQEVKKHLEQYFNQAPAVEASTAAAALIARIRAEGVSGNSPEETIFFGAVSLHLEEHDANEVYIDLLYVDSRYRRSQLGTKTLQLLTAWADYYCCRLVLEVQPLPGSHLFPFLELGGEEDNPSNAMTRSQLAAFYRKFGFSGSGVFMSRKPRCKSQTSARESGFKGVQAMPRGFSPSNEEFATKLHGWFIIVQAEGSVDACDNDPVHVAVIYDEAGNGPHTASLYVDQNRFHAGPDTALQAADEMHEDWMKEHYADHLKELEEERLAEHVKEYLEEHPGAKEQEAISAVQDSAYQEAEEWFHERMDGMAWTMTAAEFVAALDSWPGDKYTQVILDGVTVTRLEECGETTTAAANKLLPKISPDKAYEISKSIWLRLTGTGLSEDEIEKAVKDALAEYDVRPGNDRLPHLSSTRRSARRRTTQPYQRREPKPRGFLYSITYDVVTEESAEEGDVADSGYVDEDVEASTLQEVVLLADDYSWSEGSGRWFSTEPTTDYTTGDETSYALHVRHLDGSELTPGEYRKLKQLLGVR